MKYLVVAIVIVILAIIAVMARGAKDMPSQSDRKQLADAGGEDIEEFKTWLDSRALPYAGINVLPGVPEGLHGSRIGGPAALAEGEFWPADKNGKPMIMLAQINFADMPALPDYPEQGMLQFFVPADNLWGLNFDDFLQGDRKVIWRPDPAEATKLVQQTPYEGAYSPFQSEEVWRKGRAIGFTKNKMHPNWMDWSVVGRVGELEESGVDYNDIDAIFVNNKQASHYVGGYPDFTQDDPRSADRYGDYDRVLFQMGWDDHVMWGDAGEATFLIRKQDLIDRNFDRVLYSWDCS